MSGINVYAVTVLIIVEAALLAASAAAGAWIMTRIIQQGTMQSAPPSLDDETIDPDSDKPRKLNSWGA